MQEGKSVLVRPLPPQAWPLAITVPLSDFLAGSKPAGRAERLTVDSLVGDNVLAPIAAVEPKIAGEETIKGVRCLRLELQQEDAEDGERFLVRLWLAKDKHLIPARQQVLSDTDNGPLLVSESRVDAWLEVKPTVWLPKHITFVTYDAGPGKTRRESRRETFALEKANLDVKYPPTFFRDLQFPPELPVFTIKEGRLEGSFHKSAEPPDGEARLKEIAEQLRQEEARYNRLSVNAAELRTTNPLFGDIGKIRKTKMHSLLFNEQAYTDARHETWRFDGTFRPMLWTEAFDGRYYRTYGRHPPEHMKGGYAWVCLQNLFVQGNTLVPVMLRPHSALVPGGTSYRRLADILWPAPGSVPPPFEKKVEYLGEAKAGQLTCEVLCVRSAFGRESPFKFLYWLAKDRNLIPVQFEEYRGDATLPVRLEVVDQFQEPSHGVWYPAHRRAYIFRQQIPPAVRRGLPIRRPVLGLSRPIGLTRTRRAAGHLQPAHRRRSDRSAVLRQDGQAHRQDHSERRQRPANAGRKLARPEPCDQCPATLRRGVAAFSMRYRAEAVRMRSAWSMTAGVASDCSSRAFCATSTYRAGSA